MNAGLAGILGRQHPAANREKPILNKDAGSYSILPFQRRRFTGTLKGNFPHSGYPWVIPIPLKGEKGLTYLS
jgi:hypothetical protein